MVRLTILGALLLVISVYVVWRSSLLPGFTSPTNKLALGAQVYVENCAACHGPKGEGHADIAAAPALDASEHAWHHADGQLQQLILEGGQIMPSFRQ